MYNDTYYFIIKQKYSSKYESIITTPYKHNDDVIKTNKTNYNSYKLTLVKLCVSLAV